MLANKTSAALSSAIDAALSQTEPSGSACPRYLNIPYFLTHAQVLANKTSAALSSAIDAALAQTEPLGAACVPSLPAPQREAYVKQVASSAGIVALASAVARNTTQMLPLLAVGE